MTIKRLTLLENSLLIISFSILTTLCSYIVVTGHNVRLSDQGDIITITGEHIVELPCASPDTDWRSDDPILPETRGIPFNYHYWNPCDGTKVLRTGFVLDVGFWCVVFGASYFVFRIWKRQRAHQ